MNKILVTGAAGFLGSHIIDSLLKEGCVVFGVDIVPFNQATNLKHLEQNKGFFYHTIDIRNFEQLDSIFNDEFSTIYHYASVVGVQNYLLSPKDVLTVSIIGTQNVIDLALKYKVKILFSSTSEVYGKNPKIPWKESDDRVLGSTEFERWTYSSGKAVAEHLLMSNLKNTDIEWLIVRYFNIYGPKQNQNFVVAKNILNYVNNKPLICHNNGLQTRCYTYVDDAIEATILLAKSNTSGIFNIGSNVEVNINQLLSVINSLDVIKQKIETIDTSELLGDGFEDIPRRVPAIGKIKEVIGWQANTSLETGIKKTFEWFKKNS